MNDHYFSTQPSTAGNDHQFDLAIRGRNYQIRTQDGVFSAHGLDKGSAVFLSKVPQPDLGPHSLAVDLGCGWGPITLALASEAPHSTVLGVDVNERSMNLARENADQAQLSNVTIEESTAALSRLRQEGRTIDLLWSNPPIRIGKAELHQLLSNWFALLSSDGVAYIVVQKNLGADSLARWITEQGYTVQKVGSAKGFRVFEIRRSFIDAE
ncbi:class I SAM-dependent methyltransferase [Arcanobacterium bovis]|uniref:Methyltransferase domain-containing protein n=1 Tax=Arcanobacterium bovis TaxID=2529275 RepID=A0A4Q9V0Z4_9ACTO|nr:methyltransferase [Arcanobacterium bovis]TBW22746.1 methyltransferase domain-containing protein [Arcanobacterium bovis]